MYDVWARNKFFQRKQSVNISFIDPNFMYLSTNLEIVYY